MTILTRVRAFALLVMLCPATCFAGNWDKPVADLAKAIAGVTGAGYVTLSVENASSLRRVEIPEIQRELEAQLRTAGVRVSNTSNPTSDIRLTLSENSQGFLWVAEIKQGNQSQVKMISVPREESSAVSRNSPRFNLQKMLLFAQSKPILDAYLMDSASPNARLFVLDAESVTVYGISGNTWQKQQSWAIAHNHPFPRDLRGLLVGNAKGAVDVYLPGTVCEASAQALVCRDGDDPWKLGTHAAFFNSARNYFTGATVPANGAPGAPFYSAVWMGSGATVFAGVDGNIRSGQVPVSGTDDWGSDIASIKTGCGSGTLLLTTGAGDDSQVDTLRAFEIVEHEAVLASAPAEFPGPVTALWSHDTGNLAFVHNLRNGNYEAYSVSVTCNQ